MSNLINLIFKQKNYSKMNLRIKFLKFKMKIRLNLKILIVTIKC